MKNILCEFRFCPPPPLNRDDVGGGAIQTAAEEEGEEEVGRRQSATLLFPFNKKRDAQMYCRENHCFGGYSTRRSLLACALCTKVFVFPVGKQQ